MADEPQGADIEAPGPAFEPVEGKNRRMDEEPAITIGVIQGFVAALLAVLVAFGLSIDNQTQVALLALIATAWPLWTALRIRRQVFAPQSVRKLQVRAAMTADAAAYDRGVEHGRALASSARLGPEGDIAGPRG